MMLVRQSGRLNTNSGGPCCTTCGLLDILILHRTHSHPPTTTSEQAVIRQSEDISTYSCMDEISLSIHHTHKYVRLSIHPTFKKKNVNIHYTKMSASTFTVHIQNCPKIHCTYQNVINTPHAYKLLFSQYKYSLHTHTNVLLSSAAYIAHKKKIIMSVK